MSSSILSEEQASRKNNIVAVKPFPFCLRVSKCRIRLAEQKQLFEKKISVVMGTAGKCRISRWERKTNWCASAESVV
jgi:hypothetical protein